MREKVREPYRDFVVVQLFKLLRYFYVLYVEYNVEYLHEEKDLDTNDPEIWLKLPDFCLG